jgi:cytochrome c551/c552
MAEGLQRLVWNEKMPFEMHTIKAMPDGFEIEFTLPVDKKSAEDLASYSVESFTYKYHAVYGSPPVNNIKCPIKGVKVSEDGLKARIIVDSLRLDYVHNITLEGVREKDHSYSLVHPTGFYTLHHIPQGDKLPLSKVSTFNSSKAKPAAKPEPATVKPAPGKTAVKPAVTKAATFEEVKPLLAKYTCLACHAPNKRQIGPAYADVAKRHYTNEQILKLLANPKPQNWPEFATEMPPMPQVPRNDALKIAGWINSLK